MSSDPRGERLLELLLQPAGPERDAELRRLTADPALAAEAEELRALFRTCRSTLLAEEEGLPYSASTAVRDGASGRRASGAEALSERILARTTREDLSWRGDVRLVTSFLRERLRASPRLRLAAASLMLLHLVAVPAIAWYVWRAPQHEQAVIFFEPAGPALEFPASEAPLGPLPELELGGEARHDPLELENTLRLARYLLATEGAPRVPALVGAPPSDLRIRLLRARSAGLHDRTFDPLLENADALEQADAVARALWVEALLDRYVLDGSSSALLPTLLARMAPVAHDVAGGQDAAGELEAAALERAARYGLLPVDQQARLAGALHRARERMSRRGPLDPAWFEVLARALAEAGSSGPEVDAWLAWPGAPRPPR